MNKRNHLQPDEHYGQRSRRLMAERRGELHLGQPSEASHEEYVTRDVPVPEMAGQQSTKHPLKGNTKG